MDIRRDLVISIVRRLNNSTVRTNSLLLNSEKGDLFRDFKDCFFWYSSIASILAFSLALFLTESSIAFNSAKNLSRALATFDSSAIKVKFSLKGSNSLKFSSQTSSEIAIFLENKFLKCCVNLRKAKFISNAFESWEEFLNIALRFLVIKFWTNTISVFLSFFKFNFSYIFCK